MTVAILFMLGIPIDKQILGQLSFVVLVTLVVPHLASLLASTHTLVAKASNMPFGFLEGFPGASSLSSVSSRYTVAK